MNRRELIMAVGGAAAWSHEARAEQTRKIARIGYLAPIAGPDPAIEEAFAETLQQLGWVEGQNITIEKRYSGGRQDTVAARVEEIIGLSVDVIVAWGPLLALEAKRAAPQIPLTIANTVGILECSARNWWRY